MFAFQDVWLWVSDHTIVIILVMKIYFAISDSDRRVPAELGQESQASSCLRKGTPLASRFAQSKFVLGGGSQ